MQCGFSVCACLCVGDCRVVSYRGIPRVKNKEKEEMFAFYTCRFSICKTPLCAHALTSLQVWYQNTSERSTPAGAMTDGETAHVSAYKLYPITPHLGLSLSFTACTTKPFQFSLCEIKLDNNQESAVEFSFRSC